MAAFTRWILGHKLLVALCWVAVTVGGGLTVGRATGALSQQFAPTVQECLAEPPHITRGHLLV